MARGEFALVKEQLETGLKTSGQPVRRGTMAHDHDVYAILADTAAQERNLDALRKYAPLIEELAVRDDHRLYRAVAYRAQGVLHRLKGDYTESKTCLARALELFEQLGARWQIGCTHDELGELARTQNEFEKARDHFTLALAAFEELRAAPEVEKTRVVLNELSHV